MNLKKKESFDLSAEPSLNLATKIPIYSDKKIWPGKEVTGDLEGISNANEVVNLDQSKSKASGSPQQRKKKFNSYRKKSESLETKRVSVAKKKSGLMVRQFKMLNYLLKGF